MGICCVRTTPVTFVEPNLLFPRPMIRCIKHTVPVLHEVQCNVFEKRNTGRTFEGSCKQRGWWKFGKGTLFQTSTIHVVCKVGIENLLCSRSITTQGHTVSELVFEIIFEHSWRTGGMETGRLCVAQSLRPNLKGLNGFPNRCSHWSEEKNLLLFNAKRWQISLLISFLSLHLPRDRS